MEPSQTSPQTQSFWVALNIAPNLVQTTCLFLILKSLPLHPRIAPCSEQADSNHEGARKINLKQPVVNLTPILKLQLWELQELWSGPLHRQSAQ